MLQFNKEGNNFNKQTTDHQVCVHGGASPSYCNYAFKKTTIDNEV